MKYYIENWNTEETLFTFDTEEERQKFINKECYIEDGVGFYNGVRISIYEA